MRNPKVITYSLLVAVIIIWTLSWPTSKIALRDMPPMWFSSFRLVIGFITMFGVLFLQKNITLPKRKDFAFIISIGILQMACFLILINFGLLYVDAGRSAILVYSTPFIVTPIAIIFFQERLSFKKIVGLALGLLGIMLLFAPWSFDWTNHKIIIGNLILFLAATCWAIAMIHTRYGKWHSQALQLVPWQLLIASIFVLIVSIIFEPHPKIEWTFRLWMSGLYNGFVSTGLAFAAIVFVTQRLPVVNTSLLLLGVPVLSLLVSAWWLGEKITLDTVLALLLIIGGLVVITLDNEKLEKE